MNSGMTNAQLFVSNENLNAFTFLGEITEAELTSVNEESETSPSEKLKYFNNDFAASFEATTEKFNKYTFYFLIGQKYRIPNNWLKRHGQPMNRKTIKRTPAIINKLKYRKKYRKWRKKQR